MKYAYPVDLEEQEDGSFVASFSGLTGATDRETREECLKEASDLLVSTLAFYVEDNKILPKPPRAMGRPLVYVPVLEALKFALHDAIIKQKLTNKSLGERLGISEVAVRRLRDPLHESKISRLEAALRAVGLQSSIEIRPALEAA